MNSTLIAGSVVYQYTVYTVSVHFDIFFQCVRAFYLFDQKESPRKLIVSLQSHNCLSVCSQELQSRIFCKTALNIYNIF